MAAPWEDPEKLRKLARVTLGYEEEDEEDDGDANSDEKVSPSIDGVCLPSGSGHRLPSSNEEFPD